MKIKFGLIGLISLVFCSSLFAQKEARLHVKCYLQIEDNSHIVHQFVTSENNKKLFSATLIDGYVFMPDGKTKQQIITVYECVDTNSNFKNKNARKLEENTAF